MKKTVEYLNLSAEEKNALEILRFNFKQMVDEAQNAAYSLDPEKLLEFEKRIKNTETKLLEVLIRLRSPEIARIRDRFMSHPSDN